MNDTIAAISTPPGEGGIAIIRMSGDQVQVIAQQIFASHSGRSIYEMESHRLALGLVKDAEGQILDEALVVIMRAPHSYTGEDVIEINCHGGMLAARRCLEAVLRYGARLADPGEFTRRAFLNGRLDMVQAESVIEVIRAKSEQALVMAANNLRGMLSRDLARLEERLVWINSRLEGSIDFPEEVGEPDWEQIEALLTEIVGDLKKLVEGGKRARIYRDGIKVAIIGKPNVGKSSLLNVLVRKDKAIVTDIPGTTRDVIEETIQIRGIPVQIMDTAGIRATRDTIEAMGMQKTRDAMEEADILLFLVDAASGFTAEDEAVLAEIDHRNPLIVVNKDDIEDKLLSAEQIKPLVGDMRVVEISARLETGIDKLEKMIEEMILGHQLAGGRESAVMMNLRQEMAVQAVLDHVQDALQGVRDRAPTDGLAVDTWGAISWIEELTGKNIRAEVMERIFADFCIGK